MLYPNKNVQVWQIFFFDSYDMKAVTKEWSIAEKISTPFVGIEPGPPG